MKIMLADMERLLEAYKTGAQKLQVSQLQSEGWFETIVAREMSGEFIRMGSDAVIEVSGPLSYKYDFWSWYSDGRSYAGIAAKLANAANDDTIDRIVMVFDTPGGEVCGLPELGDSLYNIAKKKKCVAVIDPMCASAGYWLASQCNEIHCLASGWVGSCGTQTMLVSMDKALKDAGYDMRIIRADISPSKNIEHPYEPMKQEAIDYWQEQCNISGEQFIDAIARGRKLDRNAVKEQFGKGLMLRGDSAKAAGMVDYLGTLAEVLSTKKTTASRLRGETSRASFRTMRNI